MKDLEAINDILENEVLSVEKLHALLKGYSERVDEVARSLTLNGDLIGDELSDEFFNQIDEESLLSFRTDEHVVELSLGRVVSVDIDSDEMEFDGCYFIEVRNPKDQLQDGFDFPLGEEREMIQKLAELGFVQ